MAINKVIKKWLFDKFVTYIPKEIRFEKPSTPREVEEAIKNIKQEYINKVLNDLYTSDIVTKGECIICEGSVRKLLNKMLIINYSKPIRRDVKVCPKQLAYKSDPDKAFSVTVFTCSNGHQNTVYRYADGHGECMEYNDGGDVIHEPNDYYLKSAVENLRDKKKINHKSVIKRCFKEDISGMAPIMKGGKEGGIYLSLDREIFDKVIANDFISCM